MKNKLLKSFIAIGVAVSANYPCLAGSTESQSEAPTGMTVPMPSAGSQVNDGIQSSSHLSPEAKHVNVSNKDDAVVLTGTVPTNGDKQKINSIAEQSGATNVRNEIKVEKSAVKKQPVPKVQIIKH
jgi:osmotically-inducible protein OsmY